MKSRRSTWGRTAALVLVGVVLLTGSGGFSVAHVPGPSSASETTPTPPELPSPPEVPGLDRTPTETATATPPTAPSNDSTAGGADRGEDVRVVDDNVGNAGVVTGGACENATYASIQQAVSDARPGETVLVCEGTYLEHVTVERSDLSILAEGSVTVDAGVERGFNIRASEVTVRGFHVRTTAGVGVWIDGTDRVVVRDTRVEYIGENGISDERNDGIRIEGASNTVVRNTTVVGFEDDAVAIEERSKGDDRGSTGTLVVGSHISGFPGYANYGIWVGRQATGTVIRDTVILDIRMNPELNVDGRGIKVLGNRTSIVDTVIRRPSSHGIDVGSVDTEIVGVLLAGNVIHDSQISNGIHVGYHADFGTYSVRIVENEITHNNWNAIYLDGRFAPGDVEIHRNVILNNGMGIQNGNPFGSSSLETKVVNATNNVWACGGPSGGLRDPYTDRMANGTGDPVSAGDEPGYANVHFDPFLVRNSASCPAGASGSTPSGTTTGTPITTPTPMPTLTETPTSTPTKTPPAGLGSGTQPGGGPEGREVGGGVEGEAMGGDGAPDDSKANPTQTPITPPPETETPPPSSPTITPTPVVEPGFGTLASVVGAVGLAALLAGRRRRSNATREDRYD